MKPTADSTDAPAPRSPGGAWRRRWAAWRTAQRSTIDPGPGTHSSPARTEAWLRHLEWTTLRRLDGLLQGDIRTLMRGQGLDLADLRDYQPGDDVRHIDWNATARLQAPQVRRFLESRDMGVWLLVDLSPSMHFGSAGRSKASTAIEAAVVLAALFTRHGHRVGAMVWSRATGNHEATATRPIDRLTAILPPAASRRQVLHLAEILHQACGRTPLDAAPDKPDQAAATATWRRWWETLRRPSPAALPPTSLADLLDAAAPLLRQRHTVLLLSDFVSAAGWEPALGRLARRHDVIAVRVDDALERALPDLGDLTLQDLETGEQLRVDLSDPDLRARYAQLAQAAEAEISRSCARAGVDLLNLRTDGTLVDALPAFCAERRRRSHRGAAGGARPRAAEVA